MPAASIVQLIEQAHKNFSLSPDAEITIEANPGTVTQAGLREIRSGGVNRLSLGMQAGQERLLRLLGRIHTWDQVGLAVEAARRAGFDELNLDLIYGIPGQTCSEWEESLQKALDFTPEHLSLYALTLDEGVVLEKKIRKGEIPPIDDDLAAEMYELAEERLAQAGFEHYEISNWAKVENGRVHRCRHNLQYWKNGDYLGIGVGAHGSISGVRIANTTSLEDYLKRIASNSGDGFPFSPAVVTRQVLSREEIMGESMLLGLRLTETGISEKEFYRRFGISYNNPYQKQIEGLTNKGLLEKTAWNGDEGIRLTKRGRLLGNQVFMEFV